MTAWERMAASIVREDTGFTSECWLWQKSLRYTGYGEVWFDGRLRYAHRVAYEIVRGPIPAGLQLDHLCRVRRCVNPDHLEPVTNGVNARRGYWAMKTHCPRGHAYTEENTRHNPTAGRQCRTCDREAKRRRSEEGAAA